MSINHQTVHQLRENKYQVWIDHYRQLWDYETKTLGGELHRSKITNPELIAPFAGRTVVKLTTPEGKTYVAEAKCSLYDNYNKKRGVGICLGRILKKVAQEVQNKGK